MKSSHTLRNFLLAAGLVIAPVHAATITWEVFNITGNASDISTTGTLVKATSGNAGGTAIPGGAPVTVNGVDFAQGRIQDNTDRDRIATVPTLSDSSYQILLEAASARNSSVDSPITFSGLTVGNTYQIQIWASNEGLSTSKLVLNDGGSTAPNPNTSGHAELLYRVSEGQPGQYALGTFVADDTSQTFVTRRWITSGQSGTEVNAIQLREIAVIPEPRAALLGGIGLLLLLRRRR